jgi:glucose-6-phosphate isomerase
MNDKKIISEDFDFGFSFTNDIEDNIAKLEEQHKSKDEIIESLQGKINTLYDMITVFLDNLTKNPEKATIHWPNRAEKITEYKKKLKMIVEGK